MPRKEASGPLALCETKWPPTNRTSDEQARGFAGAEVAEKNEATKRRLGGGISEIQPLHLLKVRIHLIDSSAYGLIPKRTDASPSAAPAFYETNLAWLIKLSETRSQATANRWSSAFTKRSVGRHTESCCRTLLKKQTQQKHRGARSPRPHLSCPMIRGFVRRESVQHCECWITNSGRLVNDSSQLRKTGV
jgi:hypothetical protein